MSTAQKIFEKARSLPQEAQNRLLQMAEAMSDQYPSGSPSALSLAETAELRGRLAAWEEDWEAPGMEAYGRA